MLHGLARKGSHLIFRLMKNTTNNRSCFDLLGKPSLCTAAPCKKKIVFLRIARQLDFHTYSWQYYFYKEHTKCNSFHNSICLAHEGDDWRSRRCVPLMKPPRKCRPIKMNYLHWCNDQRVSANHIIFHRSVKKSRGLWTRLSTVKHRRLSPRFFPRGGGGCTQARKGFQAHLLS